MEQTSTPQGSPVVSRLNATSVSNTTSSPSNGAQGIKLPKIQLQKFRGDITKFQSFWQSFRVAVDESEGLSKVQKLNFLINSLESIVYKALEGLKLTEENYKSAVKILGDRFGKLQHEISAHMQELLNLQSLNNEKANNLFLLYDNILVHVRGLELNWIGLERLGVSSKNMAVYSYL